MDSLRRQWRTDKGAGFQAQWGRFGNVTFLERAPDDRTVRFYQNYQPVSVLAGVYRLRLAAPGSQPFLRSPARAANVARFFGRDLPHWPAP